MPQAKRTFDPIAVFQTLDKHGVVYIIIGALGRVIRGTDELTEGVDIVPAMAEKNLRQLKVALGDLNARRPDGDMIELEKDLREQPVLELQTDAGEVKIVAEPAWHPRLQDPSFTCHSRVARQRRPTLRRLARRPRDHARRYSTANRTVEPLRTLRTLIEHDYQRRRQRTRRNPQRSRRERGEVHACSERVTPSVLWASGSQDLAFCGFPPRRGAQAALD